jgi:hypothetical protein
MRIFRAQKNLLAASVGSKETAINTEQSLDQSLMVAMSTMMDITTRREDNVNDLNGKEEADVIYDLGAIIDGVSLVFDKAQPNHFAFILAYALGAVSSGAAGAGYSHVITPIENEEDESRSNPSFTAAMRMGDTVLKRRFASCFVDQVTADFNRDSWLRLEAAIRGTGKHTDNVTSEEVTAAYNATELTLAANAVEGSTAQERLDNVHRIRVDATGSGQWEEVDFSAVSDATPAVITISAPGGVADDKTYEIIYVPTESAWCTFPARVSETPMRVSECAFTWGGQWDGSDFNGGKTMDAEIVGVQYSLMNNLDVQFGFGASGNYASRCFRTGRVQKLTLDREFRDYILKQHVSDNDTFGIKLIAEGAEFDTGHNYTVQMVCPKCGVLNAPLSINDKIIAERGEIVVMEDDTYGSVIWTVKNLQSGYAA